MSEINMTKVDSILFPNPSPEERLTQESFTEFSPVVPFNLLADPNASFRNLALNTGFVSRGIRWQEDGTLW